MPDWTGRGGRRGVHRVLAKHGRAVSAGNDQQRDARGDDDGESHADEAAHLHVIFIAAVGAKIHTGGAGCGKEADDERHHGRENAEGAQGYGTEGVRLL